MFCHNFDIHIADVTYDIKNVKMFLMDRLSNYMYRIIVFQVENGGNNWCGILFIIFVKRNAYFRATANLEKGKSKIENKV
jgi:hypothetical protein